MWADEEGLGGELAVGGFDGVAGYLFADWGVRKGGVRSSFCDAGLGGYGEDAG